MNENEIKNLIQKSIVSTSDQFTSKLIENLEPEQEIMAHPTKQEYTFPNLWMIAGIILTISFTIFMFGRKELPIMIISCLVLVYAFSYILGLKKQFDQLVVMK